MKKRVVSLLVSSMLSLCLLAGCGGSEPANGSVAAPSESQKVQENTQSGEMNTVDAGYIYTQNGIDIAVNALMTPIADALGEPDKYFESESCAFQGMDKVYTYGSAVITTYPKDDKDYVFTIELKDDTITTAEGIYIGSAKEDVTAAYGTPFAETDVALVFEKGDCQLTFFFEDNCVTNITYAANLD